MAPVTSSELSVESASLSYEDRRLVRTEAIQTKLKAAASSRAPRFHQPLKPSLAAAV